jgi:hypothetical protein
LQNFCKPDKISFIYLKDDRKSAGNCTKKGLKMIRNFIFSAITALVLIGCAATTHNFMIRFNEIEGLRKNDQVFFAQTPIGVVKDVEYTDTGDYLVKVAVEDQYSSLPKDSSIFYIDSNPQNDSQKAILIIQIQEDGNTLEKNTIVEGETKYAAIYGQIAKKFQEVSQKFPCNGI